MIVLSLNVFPSQLALPVALAEVALELITTGVKFVLVETALASIVHFRNVLESASLISCTVKPYSVVVDPVAVICKLSNTK